jgi:hypothetical protein
MDLLNLLDMPVEDGAREGPEAPRFECNGPLQNSGVPLTGGGAAGAQGLRHQDPQLPGHTRAPQPRMPLCWEWTKNDKITLDPEFGTKITNIMVAALDDDGYDCFLNNIELNRDSVDDCPNQLEMFSFWGGTDKIFDAISDRSFSYPSYIISASLLLVYNIDLSSCMVLSTLHFACCIVTVIPSHFILCPINGGGELCRLWKYLTSASSSASETAPMI